MFKSRRHNIKWGDINMAEVALNKLIVHFAQSNKVEGKSPRTIDWYTQMLEGFNKFLEASNYGGMLGGFDIQTVREFIAHEQDRGMSPYTVQGKVRTLKAFSSWLFREGYMSENLLDGFKLPKVPVNLVEPLANDEVDRLLCFHNPLTTIGCRDTAILILMLDTGIRLSELCGLRMGDTHIDECYLKVLGKGNKERLLPLGSSSQKILWRYVIHFRPEPINKNTDYFFLTLDGKYLQPNAVKLLIKRWGKKAGVPRLHSHLCRHTFATNYLIHNCGDVFRLQQILGHSSLEMVRRYVHFASSHALITGKVLSPVDQRGLNKLKGYKTDQALKKIADRKAEK